jgi:DNA helicase IV
MYACLYLTMTLANAAGADPKLAVTVLADENQRLTPAKNSTITEIRQNLGLHVSDRNVFVLTKNYRNTRQIAEFARCFYVGLSTGVPSMPSRAGDLPMVSVVAADTHKRFLTVCAEKIAKYAKLRRTEEIAVLVMRDAVRIRILNRLKSRLSDEKIKIQSYSGSDEEYNDVEALTFDKPGHVTVLNSASAKGLEFDAVFIVDPAALMSSGSADLYARMTLYVLCSRARSFLNVMLLKDENASNLMLSVSGKLYEKEEL